MKRCMYTPRLWFFTAVAVLVVTWTAAPVRCQMSAPSRPLPTSPQNNTRDDRMLRKLQTKIEKEPSLEAMIAAALRYGDAGVGRSDHWATAVRRAPLLPTLKVSAGWDVERDESLDRTQDDPDHWGADTDNDVGFQVTAQWTLSELVYNPDELRVFQTLTQRAERREELISVIIGYYYERRRLQYTEALRPAASAEEALERQLRISELTAFINALTGGIFTRGRGNE